MTAMSVGSVPTITMFSHTAFAVEAMAPSRSWKPWTKPSASAGAFAKAVDHCQQQHIAVDVRVHRTVCRGQVRPPLVGFQAALSHPDHHALLCLAGLRRP